MPCACLRRKRCQWRVDHRQCPRRHTSEEMPGAGSYRSLGGSRDRKVKRRPAAAQLSPMPATATAKAKAGRR